MTISILVLPVPGAPISFEQIERRSHKQGEAGAPALETLRRNVYRDSSGRVRIQQATPEWSSDESSAASSSVDQILDPVGSRMIVLSTATQKTAFLYSLPKIGEVRFANYSFADDGDEGASSSPEKFNTENMGKRTIEGVEFIGTRILATREGGAGAMKTVEEWHSANLNLIGLIVVTKPNETYTAGIQNIRFEEPSPDLFMIPPDCKIIDVSDQQ